MGSLISIVSFRPINRAIRVRAMTKVRVKVRGSLIKVRVIKSVPLRINPLTKTSLLKNQHMKKAPLNAKSAQKRAAMSPLSMIPS